MASTINVTFWSKLGRKLVLKPLKQLRINPISLTLITWDYNSVITMNYSVTAEILTGRRMYLCMSVRNHHFTYHLYRISYNKVSRVPNQQQ